MPKRPKQKRAWFETFFTGMALDCWRNALPPEYTKVEADFIEAELSDSHSSSLRAAMEGRATASPRSPARWLDVPCGHGRHAIELARRGHSIVGIDLSADEIAEAKRRARGVSGVEFRRGDMRKLRLKQTFNGAYCFGNSFGYLEWPDMQRFVRAVFAALKPRSRFFINTGMAAESILPRQGYFNQRESAQIGDMAVTSENRYLPEESCVESDMVFVRGSQTETRTDHHHVYTVAEIKRLLTDAGFKVLHLFGTPDRKPFTLGSGNLYVVTAKP